MSTEQTQTDRPAQPGQTLEDMAFHGRGIPRGMPLKVVTCRGKTGIVPAEPEAAAPIGDSEQTLEDMAFHAYGIPLGTPLKVVTCRGKVGIVRDTES